MLRSSALNVARAHPDVLLRGKLNAPNGMMPTLRTPLSYAIALPLRGGRAAILALASESNRRSREHRFWPIDVRLETEWQAML